MNYTDAELGFSFQLPDEWQRTEHMLNPSFRGTRFFVSDQGLISIMVGEVEDQFVNADARKAGFEQYIKGMGFTDIQLSVGETKLGNEPNTILAQYKAGNRNECMISAVQGIRQFLIRYEGNSDSLVESALKQLVSSFQFLSPDPSTIWFPLEEARVPSPLYEIMTIATPEGSRRGTAGQREKPLTPEMTELEAKASSLRHEGRCAEAICAYLELIALGLGPLNEAETWANLMQMYEREGDKVEAKKAAMKALDLIDDFALYKSPAGVFLRGYVNSYVGKLDGKSRWITTPRYTDGVPAELNLSPLHGILARFSTAAIGSVWSAAVGAYYPYPRLEEHLANGTVHAASIFGLIAGWLVGGFVLELAVAAVAQGSNCDKSTCLNRAVTLLTVLALIDLAVIPVAVSDVLWEPVCLLTLYVLGFIASKMLFQHHDQQIEL